MQDGGGTLHDRLDHAEQAERVVFVLGVERLQGLDGVQGERVVERKILLQLCVHADLVTAHRQDLRGHERGEQAHALLQELAFACRRLVAISDQRAGGVAAVLLR